MKIFKTVTQILLVVNIGLLAVSIAMSLLGYRDFRVIMFLQSLAVIIIASGVLYSYRGA